MTAGLFIAGVIVFAMAVVGVWLLLQGEAVPAARATGEAPDPTEEEEARRSKAEERRSGVLVERGDSAE